MKKVSVVIPVYYNEGSLPLLIIELMLIEKTLLHKNVTLELIFVDDGSGDNSFAELQKIKQLRPATKIIKLTRNFGAIHASKTGFQLITGDCFMILAADLQDPPELILSMVDKWLAGNKFIVCTRQIRDDPLFSKIWAKLYYFLLRIFVIKNYPKGGFDLALMNKDMLPYMQNNGKNANTSLFAYWLGFKPIIIEYQRRPRIHGKSRWSFRKKIKFFVDSLLGFSVLPIRIVSIIGAIVSLISFGYGFLVIINAMLEHVKISGFATLVALITFLLGLIIVMLGVIGEYIWRIFDETNKRPEAVVDEIL